MIDDTLNEYGRGLGLPALEFNEFGVASLAFDATGQLFIERLEQSVMLYVVRTSDRLDDAQLVDALAVCHWSHNHPFDVNAAASGDTGLVFSAVLPESTFDLPTLERAIAFLNRLHDSVQGVGV